MKKINNKEKRKLRNRKKLKKMSNNRFRISVSKSLKNLSAQIIDDKSNKTIVSASSTEKEIKKNSCIRKVNNGITVRFSRIEKILKSGIFVEKIS